ncbi:MAG: hydrogenase maturation protease [Thermoanaerobaculum sp.]
MKARALVVGFGNPLMGDDGVGPAVVSRLMAMGVPQGARVVEGGTDATVLANLWRGEPRVFLVDAVATGDPPGTIHRLSSAELAAWPQKHGDAHSLSLPECVGWVLLARPEMALARIELVGIEPERVAPGAGLSDPVSRAVVVLAELLAAEVAVSGPGSRKDQRMA